MVAINQNKCLRSNGFRSDCFKSSWHIGGEDITKVVLQFIDNGTIQKQLNATILTLISNISNPLSTIEFSRIASCNILHMCITKMICKIEMLISSLLSLWLPLCPLLFVTAVENLTGVLLMQAQQKGFKHHSVHRKMNLVSLIFVDYLVLFCKGDAHSVDILIASS